MTPTRIAILLTLASTAHGLACAEDAPITSVTLYPGSAMVERSGAVQPGMTHLDISGLPAGFDLRTLRVQASAGIQVGQVVTRDVGKEEAANARQAELEARIQALQDSKDVLNVDAKSAALVQNYLEHLNGAGPADRAPVAADGKAMGAMLDTIRRGAHDAFSQIQRTQVQMREIDRKIAVLQGELDKVRGGGREQRSISVQLAVRQAGTVRVSYQVNGAGWKPVYRASLDAGASRVELERLAAVSQKTGEDWNGVALKLSTGQPRRSPDAPDPQPRLLTYYKPVAESKVAAYGYAPMPAPAPAPAPMVAMAARAPAGEPYIPPVIEEQGAFDTEFSVPNRVTLPADGREVTVALSSQPVPVTQRIRVVPRQDKSAVVTAEAARPAGVWLAGNVQLFRDGGYVGATHWNPQASERLVLPFGRDELIRVAVDRASQQSGTGGLLAQHGEREVTDVYTITSFHTAPVRVLVLEASPVSTSDEIKVRATFGPQPTITQWEQRQGVVGWDQPLAPHETLKISAGYAISYPKEGTVTGLP
ncbi:DUF4139 domain-containing protein [Duganella sp. LX20W]|uniref:DUF4139 domain-containing protein n=1 Tax=Rugamonas brunnea TaxID=2758569 RepID=A0A7W2ESR1_9BURK|nr:mucoidy inhibitor MuiA family protein [Rugamonas brunnea]MBA5637906.1 DUF4139 domain-containing protein [Rugamonas brunnea]